MTAVALVPRDADRWTCSSREEQKTAYISAHFGRYSQLRKQKTRNTYVSKNDVPCCSLLPSCPWQLHRWAVGSHVPPLPWVHSIGFPFPLHCRGVVHEQYQLSAGRCVLSLLHTGLQLQQQQNLRHTGVGFSLGKSLLELDWNFLRIFFSSRNTQLFNQRFIRGKVCFNQFPISVEAKKSFMLLERKPCSLTDSAMVSLGFRSRLFSPSCLTSKPLGGQRRAIVPLPSCRQL